MIRTITEIAVIFPDKGRNIDSLLRIDVEFTNSGWEKWFTRTSCISSQKGG